MIRTVAEVESQIEVTCQQGIGVNTISSLRTGDLIEITFGAGEGSQSQLIFLLLKPIGPQDILLNGQILGHLNNLNLHSVTLAKISSINLLARQADRAFFHLSTLFKRNEENKEKAQKIEGNIKQFVASLLH